MLKILGNERVLDPDMVATPSLYLNHMLGGGIPTGRINTFWGRYSSGKTTLALHIAAEAQRTLDYVPVIIDAEQSYTDPWAEKCGMDVSNRIYLRTNSVQEVLEEIMPMLKQRDKKYFFIIDSINTLLIDEFWKTDDGNNSQAIYARSQKFLIQKLAGAMHTQVGFIFIAQQSMDLSGYHPVPTANIGSATGHWSTNVIKLSTSRAKDNIERNGGGQITNKKVTWLVTKSKQSGAEDATGDIWFNIAGAKFESHREILDMAMDFGFIKKGGAWYTLPGISESKFNGWATLVEDISEAEWEALRYLVEQEVDKNEDD